MMLLPKSKIKNPNFEKSIQGLLGDNWSVTQSANDWQISLKGDKFTIDYITDITSTDLNQDAVLESIAKVLRTVERKDEHKQFIEAAGLTKYEHKHFESFGTNAWLYCGKTMFNFIPIDEFSKADIAFFQEMWSRFNVRQAVVYRKNFRPFLALLSIRKFAYLLASDQNVEISDIEKNHFWNAIPDANDFGAYIDSFLVFAPLTIAIPLDRVTGGVIVIPEESFLLPFEANAGWSEILISSPGGTSGMGTFELFGSSNLATLNQINEFSTALLQTLNSFLKWIFHPSTSSDASGTYNAGFGLQLLATVNSIFQSFSFCARNLDANEKQGHVFTTLDRISNLAANYQQLANATIGADTGAIEAKLFTKLFSEKFFQQSLELMSSKVTQKEVGTLLAQAGAVSFADLKKSLAPFRGEIGDILRTVRNTAHGAFLRNDRFLKIFSQGELHISQRLCILNYVYMLCLFLEPDTFLKELVKEG